MLKTSDDLWTAFRLLMWAGAAGLLLLPAIAMRFTAEVNWTASDFVIMGLLLATACGVIELALRASTDSAYRMGSIVAVGAGFLLVWVNLAVGIIGSEDNPANLLYVGVLGALAGGWVAANRNARRMARALFTVAAVQALIGGLAFLGSWAGQEPPGSAGILMINLFFAALWSLSGALFLRAGRREVAVA